MRFIYTKRRKERHDGFSRYLSFSRFYSRIGFYAKNGTLFYSELLLKKRVFLIVSIIIRYKMVTVNYFYFLKITFMRARARMCVCERFEYAQLTKRGAFSQSADKTATLLSPLPRGKITDLRLPNDGTTKPQSRKIGAHIFSVMRKDLCFSAVFI